VQELRIALNKVRLEIEGLHMMLNDRDELLAELCAEFKASNHAAALRTEVGTLKQSLKSQTAKAKRFWSQKCEQLLALSLPLYRMNFAVARNSGIALVSWRYQQT